MNILSAKTHLFTTTALSLGLLLAGQSAMATGTSSTTPSSTQTATQGYGPGMMGPGMMYDWTPEQRQRHWEQMRQAGYGPWMMGPGMMGPGMMYNGTPEQRGQQMGQMMGYGPGMMGSYAPSSPQTSGQ